MSAKAKTKLTPEQRKATLRRVLEKIRPYRFFVGCSLIVAAVSVAELAVVLPLVAVEPVDHTLPLPTSLVPPVGMVPLTATMPP